MAQPTTRRHSGPTIYLMGFSCLPGDREYAQAQLATGSATPYWFKERFVYGEVRARPNTQTTTAVELKCDMPVVHVREKKVKTAKEKDETANEKTAEKLRSGKGKENSGIKEAKNTDIQTKESDKNMENIKKRAHNPKRSKSISKRRQRILLLGKRVRFAWGIAITKKRQIPHVTRIKHVHRRNLTKGTNSKVEKSNSRDQVAVDTIAAAREEEEEDTESLHLLDRFPSPPRSHRPTPSLSDAMPREQGQEQGQQQQETETAFQTLARLHHSEDTHKSSDNTLEQDDSDVHAAQRERNEKNNNSWGSWLCFCMGNRK